MFKFKCNKCDNGFDKLTKKNTCPYCQSDNISAVEQTEGEAPKGPKVKIKKNVNIFVAFIDLLGSFLGKIYTEILLFYYKEKMTILFFPIFIGFYLIFKEVTGIEDLYSALMVLVFIMFRKKY